MNVRTMLATACTAALLAGCTANPATLPLAQSDAAANASKTTATGKTASHPKARLTIRVRIPKKPHRRKRVRGHYISAATEGMTLTFTGPSTFTDTIALTPSSPHCSGSPLTCTIGVALKSGSYTIAAATYDEAPVSGSIPPGAQTLSAASDVPLTIVTGHANHVGFTLDGVIASLAISSPSATAGTAFASPQALSVTAKDADGYTIVGTYEQAVSLADSDTSGATTIATSGSDDPPSGKLLSSSDTATLRYTGLAIEPATISARATGASTGSARFAPALQPIVVTTSDTLNPSFVGVDLYAASGTGSSGTFSASEAGWTNSPYDKTLTATPGSGCDSIGTYQQSANSFTATVANAPSPGTCTGLTLSDGMGQSQTVTLAYTNFSYTDGSQSIVVPAGVTQMQVTASGGSGGTPGGDSPGTGGYGGEISATLPIATAGESLAIYVGGKGLAGGSPGYNGGASGSNAGDGGGGSDIREGGSALTDRIVVAPGGGGGGGGANYAGGRGGAGNGAGNGGGSPGGEGQGLGGGGGGGANYGGGASGGAGGDGSGGDAGTSGAQGGGGTGGGAGGDGAGGGGGGGGYYGGGGGGGASDGEGGGGGGGGSSFAEATATNVTYSVLSATGNGSIIIIW